jgi:hypothetical protein
MFEGDIEQIFLNSFGIKKKTAKVAKKCIVQSYMYENGGLRMTDLDNFVHNFKDYLTR